MINKIVLHNFQSHKDSELNFNKGVNIIIGNSDSGKSAILRGLNWLSNNRPSGDSFKSYWSDDTRIEALFGGKNIIREKTKNKNFYKINDENPFEAFGQDIPQEIKEIINFSDINFQYQMDAPFMLSKSGGEIAKYINEIIDLEIIDKSLTNIEKMKREYTKKLENEREELKLNQEEIQKYKGLNELEIKISDLEKLEKKIEKNRDKKTSIDSILAVLEVNNLRIKNIDVFLERENKVNDLIHIGEKIEDNKDEKCRIIHAVKMIEIYQEDIEQEEKLLSYENKINNLLNLSDKIQTNKGIQISFSIFKKRFQETEHGISFLEKKLNTDKINFMNMMGEVCILCGSKL